MNQRILIPNRGIVALDILNALKGNGLETILLYSPEDIFSLPVKMADFCYKFYSSRLEDSYLDREAIIEKALELKVDFIHPGYGFLAEDIDFFKMAEENNIRVIGPESHLLELINDKLQLREMARSLEIEPLHHSQMFKDPLDFETIAQELQYPIIIKPKSASAGRGIKIGRERRQATTIIKEMLNREEYINQGVFVEHYYRQGQQVEIPFIRDKQGHTLLYPEIESSLQRRFRKIFQESPSPNLTDTMRERLYQQTLKIIKAINYTGLGYAEFIINDNNCYFSELNTTVQTNTLIPELHSSTNLIRLQLEVARGNTLKGVRQTKIVPSRYHIALVSLMAENPFDDFTPSSGTVKEFYHYPAQNSIFKSSLYTGARKSPLYDPYVGKLATFAKQRAEAIATLNQSLEQITIKGIRTNLSFLKSLLTCDDLIQGNTHIDFVNEKQNMLKRKRSNREIQVAAALLAAAFHVENGKQNYKEDLATRKQPGFFKRLIYRFRGR